MKIFPAIDLYEGKAVRLLKGDYETDDDLQQAAAGCGARL